MNAIKSMTAMKICSTISMALMLLILDCSLLPPPQAAEPDVCRIGSRRELFVDRFLVEKMDGVRFQLHRPRPAEIALTRDPPWEKDLNNGIAVIKDGERYLLYYSADNRLAVATSEDGVHWTKPRLGIIESDGNRNNNLVGTDAGQLMIAQVSPLPEVFLDTRPSVKPNERFKAFTLAGRSGRTKVFAWVSADGFTFQKFQRDPILRTSLYGAFDGFESLFWSPAEQQYVIYLRYAIKVDPPNPRDPNRRSVARMTSKNFTHWSEAEPMTFGDDGLLPPDHHYNNQTTLYFRAPHIAIALSNRLAQTRQALSRDQAVAAGLSLSPTLQSAALEWLIGDCGDTVMLTTRGGTHYDRLFPEALVRPGPGAENWVSRSNFALRGLHPTSPREMSIWVSRHNAQETSHIQRYVFRTDGLASIHAPFSGGEFLTRPLIFEGGQLEINYATSAVGSMRVEVQSQDGKPLPGLSLDDCVEVLGDEVAGTVRWKSDTKLSDVADQPVRLRFVMKDADLYSLRFRGE